MGIEKNFRTSESKQEIMDSLSAMYIEESPVIIWQNIDGIRNVKKARIAAIDLMSSSLILQPLLEGPVNGFDQIQSEATLYFIGESKNIVFKQVNTLRVFGQQVMVEIPDSVKLQEKRAEQRIVLDNSVLKATCEIYPGGRTDKSINPTYADLKDVSLSGMGVYLPKKNARFFYEKDKIKIDRIGSYRFGRPIHGIIVYIEEEKGNPTHMKVGIRFVNKLDAGILSVIST